MLDKKTSMLYNVDTMNNKSNIPEELVLLPPRPFNLKPPLQIGAL
jgi:hypothetical protein